MATELDHVTGLLPRGALQRSFVDAGGGQVPIAAVIADVVGLKAINELHGFAAGDAALRSVAERFREAADDARIVARLGGDELVAMFAADDANIRARAVANELAADPRQPALRAAWAPYAVDEAFAGFIDRLYAMLRKS